MRSRSFALTVSVALASFGLLPPAAAHDTGFYISAKLGTTDVDASFGDAFDQVVEGDDDSETLELGFRFHQYWAIQAGYHDFGEVPGFGSPCTGDEEVCLPINIPLQAETKAFSLSIVPQLPLGKRLSVFAKVGIVALETEVQDQDDIIDFAQDFDEEDAIWGAGLRLQIFGPIQLFYEYEGIGDSFESQYFGATFQF